MHAAFLGLPHQVLHSPKGVQSLHFPIHWACFLSLPSSTLFLMLQWPLETVQSRGLAEYYTVFPNCLADVTLGFVVGK